MRVRGLSVSEGLQIEIIFATVPSGMDIPYWTLSVLLVTVAVIPLVDHVSVVVPPQV